MAKINWNRPKYVYTAPVYRPRTYIKVPFHDKDEAKALGAKWDKGVKSWYFFTDSKQALQFKKWFRQKKIISTNSP